MQQLTDKQRLPSKEARVRFGRTLTVWLRRAGWAHDTPAKWGAAAGFSAPKNSTFSLLMRGNIDQPMPLTFMQLGLMNDRLHRRDYGHIPDINLRKRVEGQEPILTSDARPWTAAEFFAHFCGLLPAPDWVIGSPEPSAEDAQRISRELREAFEEVALARMLNPKDAWTELASHCAQLTKAELENLRAVLCGWYTYTPEELVALGDGEPGSRVQRSLNAWKLTGETQDTSD